MKKRQGVNQLTGVFPPWSKAHNDEQSLGFRLLNAMSTPIQNMDISLKRMKDNLYLQTAYLGEIDYVEKIILPKDFQFDIDQTDPYSPKPIPPQVKGIIGASTYQVNIASRNDIETLWYKTTPNRVSVSNLAVLPSHILLPPTPSEDFPKTGSWKHYDGAGYLYINCDGPGQYMFFDQDELVRARIEIEGISRRNKKETEVLIFPWSMKKTTKKEWKEITKIRAIHFPDGVNISIQSADFAFPPYTSQLNLRYSERGAKIDEFWQLGVLSGASTLELVQYNTDDARQLMMGFTDKQVTKSWELLDTLENTISAVDLAIVPYQSRAWVVSSDKKLYLYDLDEIIIEDKSLIDDSLESSNVQIEADFRHVLLGQQIEFVLFHARPVEEIVKYRIWLQDPTGQKYGVVQNTQVPFSSDFWKYPDTKITRFLPHTYSIPATMRGEYLFVLETELASGDKQQHRTVFRVESKKPIAEFDISLGLTTAPSGIAYNSDKELVINTIAGSYIISYFSDTMIVDFHNKIIYTKEKYDQLEIGTVT